MIDDPISPDGSDDSEVPAPEFEVWNHLWSGVDLAYDDLKQTVGSDAAELLDSLGAAVYTALTRLVVELSDPTLLAQPTEQYPGLQGIKGESLFQSLLAAYKSGSSPVIKHAVDLQLGEEAIGRAVSGLTRLGLLVEVLASAPLPAPVRQYLSEVVHTFLFGFDAASIALARSAFEQMAREVLLANSVYTSARLDRERPTAFNLLAELKRHRLVGASLQEAEKLITRANTVVHKHMYEDRIMQQQALTSIAELTQVLTELAMHLPNHPDAAA